MLKNVKAMERRKKMRKGWKQTTLGDLGRCISGLTYSPQDITDSSGLLVLRSSNVQNGRLSFEDNVYVTKTVATENLTKEGDILVCVRNGSKNLIGKNCLITKEGVGHTHGAFMTLFRADNPEFVYQLLQTDRYYYQVRRNLGATINSINTSDFYEFTFSVPDLAKQKKIAAILRVWDDAIEKQSKIVASLQQKRKALLGKLLLKQQANKPLKHFITPVTREVGKPTASYHALGLRSHCKGTFQRFIKDAATVAMETLYQVKENDLIVNITFAWEGAIALVKKDDECCLVSHRFPTYEIDRSKALPQFIRHSVQTRKFIESLGIISPGGAGRNRVLNKKDFLELKIWLPDLSTQKHIADIISTIELEIEVAESLLEKFKTQKRGLMQKLLTGEWPVRVEKEAA
jgi:type I restriction enzyme S subunit